jgi:hypothetical protein
MEKWIEAANDGTSPLQPVYVENAKGERRLLSLTPPPARGKRQIQEESDLVNAANTILKAYEAEH